MEFNDLHIMYRNFLVSAVAILCEIRNAVFFPVVLSTLLPTD